MPVEYSPSITSARIIPSLLRCPPERGKITTLVIFVAVVHRYASGVAWLQPWTDLIDLYWAQELCIYLFVWMAKFGAAYGVRTGIHVGVDVVVRRLYAPWHGRLIVFGPLAGALFTGIVGGLGAN